MRIRFCLECENFEDRKEIDGTVVCAKNHTPGVSCEDFQDKILNRTETELKTRFCQECENFEDRKEIDGTVVCAKLHRPGVSCEDFNDRRTALFYSYIYWAYLYSAGKTNEGKEYFEERYSRKLSNKELAYALLLDYFDLGLENTHLYEEWKRVRTIYQKKMPTISKILDNALLRYETHDEIPNLEKIFSDLISTKKS